MVNKTSISAIRALMYIARHGGSGPIPPRRIAEELSESPTYVAKVTRNLVKAGLLHVEHGVKGGVRLNRAVEDITLLNVVEACQGALVGDYCQPGCDMNKVCAYHRAAAELHDAMSAVLSRWSIGQLLGKPVSALKQGSVPCVILQGASPSVFHPPEGGR